MGGSQVIVTPAEMGQSFTAISKLSCRAQDSSTSGVERGKGGLAPWWFLLVLISNFIPTAGVGHHDVGVASYDALKGHTLFLHAHTMMLILTSGTQVSFSLHQWESLLVVRGCYRKILEKAGWMLVFIVTHPVSLTTSEWPPDLEADPWSPGGPMDSMDHTSG